MSNTHKLLALATLGWLWSLPTLALAAGESVDGFPTHQERVLHELVNRARVDPATALAGCTDCPDKGCYKAVRPVYYKRELNRAARFHSDEMNSQDYFSHASACTLVSDIAAKYPDQCDGDSTCACKGGVKQCNPTCTDTKGRVGMFSKETESWEIIAVTTGVSAFQAWLWEPTSDPVCQSTSANGHRWTILKEGSAAGFGTSGKFSTGEFGAGGEKSKIASGVAFSSTQAWANWYDAKPPTEAAINLGGKCVDMELTLGTPANGTYKAIFSERTKCTRYYFMFKDSGGNIVTYPTKGSLGVGPTSDCYQWTSSRPEADLSCPCKPQCSDKECGPDSCGGTCGTCGTGEDCDAGACVVLPQEPENLTELVSEGRKEAPASLDSEVSFATGQPSRDESTSSGGGAVKADVASAEDDPLGDADGQAPGTCSAAPGRAVPSWAFLAFLIPVFFRRRR